MSQRPSRRDLSTESVESSDSTVTGEESGAKVPDGDLSVDNQASSEASRLCFRVRKKAPVAVDNHFADVILITMLRRLKQLLLQKKVKLSLLKPFQPVKLRKTRRSSGFKTEQNKKNITAPQDVLVCCSLE